MAEKNKKESNKGKKNLLIAFHCESELFLFRDRASVMLTSLFAFYSTKIVNLRSSNKTIDNYDHDHKKGSALTYIFKNTKHLHKPSKKPL